jgi:FkbM family methyltransferase
MKIRSPYENVKFTSVFNKFKTINFFQKKNLTLFDVGGNKGQSIIEYKKFLNYKKLNIHCFEPNTDIFKKIINLKEKLYKKKNIQITANNLALSDVNKVRVFYKNSKRSALSSFYEVNKESKDYLIMKKKNYYKFVEKAFVKTVTINKYINDKKIKFVDILKIDTQGHELEVIKGANKSFNKIGIIVVSILFYDFYKKKRISFFYIEKIIKKNFIFYDLAHLYKNPKNNSIDHVEAIYVNKNLL